MSLMPTMSRVDPVLGPVISESWMVTFEVCRRLIPKLSPVSLIRLFLTVTFEAVMSRLARMSSPSRTAPSPSTSSQPRESQCHPGPLETCPGTDRKTVPAGTPVFVASGYPHADGFTAHPFTEALTLGVSRGEAARSDWSAVTTATKPASTAKARPAARTYRLADLGVFGSLIGTGAPIA